LLVVGYLMISALTEAEEEAEPGTHRTKLAGIDFHDLAIGFPAAVTLIVMPLTYSITNGIGFGFISYVVIRLAQGKWRDVHPLMFLASAAFALYFLVPLLQAHVSWI
ncbi:MAG: adenine/guanine/hypoxanthine permease, partial [Gaiellaceae bacterium]|nr:adenine/guanine/hypoxanthine permease [Gaiellaceae bacterium]